VSQIDLVPTILDLMGEDIPPGLQGRSLKPLIDGQAGKEADVFMEWNGRGRRDPGSWAGYLPEGTGDDGADQEAGRIIDVLEDPVRTVVTPDGWKFNCSPMGEHELYYLNDDPMEIENLARAKGHEELMLDLLGRIRDWQRRTKDDVRLPSCFS
jgi:arylsulfatase A-like enzyme